MMYLRAERIYALGPGPTVDEWRFTTAEGRVISYDTFVDMWMGAFTKFPGAIFCVGSSGGFGDVCSIDWWSAQGHKAGRDFWAANGPSSNKPAAPPLFNSDYSDPSKWEKTGGYGDHYENLGVYHMGLDIRSSDPTVKPIFEGHVIGIKESSSGSINIILRHEVDGKVFFSTYSHLAEWPSIKVGTPVTIDTPIAKMGGSGGVSPHLHIEVYTVEPHNIDSYTANPFIPLAHTSTNIIGNTSFEYVTYGINVTSYDPLDVMKHGGSIIK